MEKLVMSPKVGDRVKPSKYWKRGQENYFCRGEGNGMNPYASGHGTVTDCIKDCVKVTWDSGWENDPCLIGPKGVLAYVDGCLELEGVFKL